MATNNPLSDWIESDPKLREIIERLTVSGKTIEEQAKSGFYEISEAYNVPKYPDDITDKDYEEYEKKGIEYPTSVFEEVGRIRYCHPNEDIRGIVLWAIYNSKTGYSFDINECARRHFGSEEKIPEEYLVYYTGKDIDSLLHFLPDGESWVKPGVKYASKIFRDGKTDNSG
jgi:hypothetical protein